MVRKASRSPQTTLQPQTTAFVTCAARQVPSTVALASSTQKGHERGLTPGTLMLERAENQLASEWFTAESAAAESKLLGFRYVPGGVHLSKTMMLDELSAVMQASEPGQSGAVARAIDLLP